ncbi:MBL fold metallo-hydrolase [Cryomorphaceae bacterium 1068]|nr:MBL fold metallo-hydrolase [Cryomorphaceae bacterium 1068]
MKIHFKGAAGTVTGSKHLLETDKGLKILLDCGLYQGKESGSGKENRHFGFDPQAIDMVFLSHAHIDHSGLLPRLVKEGFKGKIYCTEPTRALCEIMLADSAHIQLADFRYESKRSISREDDEPLYTIEDVVKTMNLFKPLAYDEWLTIHEDVTVMFTYIGHILGSACVNLRVREGKKTHRIAYTGDIGRTDQQIIRGREPFPQAEVILCESTYGNRLHDDQQISEQRLLEIVNETCVQKRGKLIIPAFSLGRTQEIVHSLDRLETAGKLPAIKVFVDSPLSTNATEIVRSFPEQFNDRLLKYMEKDANPFGFSRLYYVRDVKYSKQINTLKEPCIIISASGMAEAGRILHHLANNIEDKNNTVLFVGYCEPNTLGGRLRAGAEKVCIYGVEHQVKAKIEIMDSYSAHGDYKEMIEYLSCQQAHLIKHLFLVHGRDEVQQEFKGHLEQAGFHHISIPKKGDVVELS